MPERIDSLTGLRFLAALGILFHHFGHEVLGGGRFATFLHSLSSCVSFFFVLSGFILVHAYRASTKRVDARSFFGARFARIYPVYLLGMLVLTVPIARYGAAYVDWGRWELVPLFFANLLALQAWIPRYANILNPPGWSISTEAFFYAIFPFAANRMGWLFFAKPLRSMVVLWLVGTTIALVLETTIAGDRQITDMGTQFASFAPIVRLPEFLMGMSLAAFRESWKPGRRWLPTALWLVGGAALVLALSQGATGIWRSAFHNSLLSPLFCMVILGLSRSRDPFERFLSSRPMELLGEASYALYILHVPTMYVYHYVLRHAGIELAPAVSIATYFVLAVLVSLFAHLWLERPTRRMIRNLLSGGAPRRDGAAESVERGRG